MISILTLAPWVLLVLSLLFLVRRRPRLQDYPAAPPVAPRVSVIVPTENDATRIGACLATLLASDYPDFEVVVVDHDSVDGTREIVESLGERSSRPLRLLRTEEVPPGRPWRAAACMLGARESNGDLLLFTEPGTVHAPDVLGRAVAAQETEDADLVTVRPRLTMHGFWERLVMPHIWLMLRARFPSARLTNRSRSPRNAVGHHQFMLFRRAAYEEVGGHDVMGLSTVEDLALPQAVSAAGRRVFLVHGDVYLETRMVRTFSDITSGWSAAVPPASRTTVAPWAGQIIPWALAATPVIFFVAPPTALIAGLLVPGAVGLTAWGLRTSLLSLVFWLVVYTFHRIRPAYAVVYPAGAPATAVIFVRSILRHDRQAK